MDQDHYETLELPKTATAVDIRNAFRRLALKWHPDKNPGNEEAATEQFKKVALAYEVLGDEDKRARYDRGDAGSFGDFDFTAFWKGCYARHADWFEGMDNSLLLNRKDMWENEEKLSQEERRERYRCIRVFTPDDIPRWDRYRCGMTPIFRSAPAKYPVNEALNGKIAVHCGSVVELEVDAIQNACNTMMAGGGGVDGAIHHGAGFQLDLEESLIDGCPYGEVRVTRGYCLPARMILHTAGPIGERPHTLRRGYENALQACLDFRIRTVGLCCVSTGVYGYPLIKASHIALDTTRRWLEEHGDEVDLIVFTCYTLEELRTYETLLQSYFPRPLDTDLLGTADVPSVAYHPEGLRLGYDASDDDWPCDCEDGLAGAACDAANCRHKRPPSIAGPFGGGGAAGGAAEEGPPDPLHDLRFPSTDDFHDPAASAATAPIPDANDGSLAEAVGSQADSTAQRQSAGS